MKTELKNGVYYVGVKDPELKVFDIIMETEFGTTYNAYLVAGEKTALIETAHNKLTDEYIKNIEEIQAVGTIDYVICNHTEPDHSGSLVKILEMNPDITVIGTTAALRNLKEITNRTFNERVAKDSDTLDLGGGKVLRFIVAPNLHWPDTMMTYLESDKILFSCDVLGAHYCADGVMDTDVKNKADYERAFKQYYDAIVSPFGTFVTKGLAKLGGVDFDMVCTSHGPVLTDFINENVEKYVKWSTPEVRNKKRASIFYVSAYGYTQKMASVLGEQLEKNGLEVYSYDIIENDMADMTEKMNSSDYILFGAPTINRNAPAPIWELMSHIDVVNAKGKLAAVFGSYGWSGEACTIMEQYLKNIKIKTFEVPFTVIFNPSEEKLGELSKFADRMINN